jgi:hypothetical protein
MMADPTMSVSNAMAMGGISVLLLGGLREKDKLKDSGLKMELFHLEAGILHLRGRKIIRTLICSINVHCWPSQLKAWITSWMQTITHTTNSVHTRSRILWLLFHSWTWMTSFPPQH